MPAAILETSVKERRMKFLLRASLILLVAILLCAPMPTMAQAVTILHSFGDGAVPGDGSDPQSLLIQGIDGNFYGMASFGGPSGDGTVFELTAKGSINILHSFTGSSSPSSGDGAIPLGGLIEGADGNFYGVTDDGGMSGRGTAFKMSSTGQITILHSFADGSVVNDGTFPQGTLIQATDGNFYGATGAGGSADKGTIFMMTPSGQVTILHSFLDGSVPNDGTGPIGSLIQAPDGNFYGVTVQGGVANQGTVFTMSPSGQEEVLHSFQDGTVANDGANPQGGLDMGPDGNFYGTTCPLLQVGAFAFLPGNVYRITPTGQETILHTFGDGSVPNDGDGPFAGLALGTDGNFYGTTRAGGSAELGTIFSITPAAR